MRHIYWEKNEIAIPAGAYINKGTGDVFIYTDNGPRRESRRLIIGRAASSTTMYPNENFKETFPLEWEEAYGEKVSIEWEKHPGLYGVLLGIGHKAGLYPILCEVAGTETANAVMDFAMHSILWKSDVALGFEHRMQDQVLFSRKMLDDQKLSSLFSERLSNNHRIKFCDSWLRKCKELGRTDCWICIDGPDMDCAAKVELAGRGHAKSPEDTNIVGFMYAVSQDGCPLAYTVNHGSVVDCQAIVELIEVLKLHDIQCRGVVLDRGFCTGDDVSLLTEKGFDYVIMLDQNVLGHTSMYAEFGKDLLWNDDCLVEEGPIYGVSKRGRIFGNAAHEAYLNLFINGSSGSLSKAARANSLIRARKTMEEEAASGIKPTVPDGMKKYLSAKWDGHRWLVLKNKENSQAAVSSTGFYTIASSKDLGPAEVNRVYDLRDVSEEDYDSVKTGQGFYATAVHSNESFEGEFFVCFITSIIRSELRRACLRNGMTTNKAVAELQRIKMIRRQESDYIFIRNLSKRQKDLLAQWDISEETFVDITADYNTRMNSKIVSQNRTLPEHTANVGHRKPGRKKKELTDVAKSAAGPAKKRGRPKGSGKKQENQQTGVAGRKPGRPKGSKNKKTLQREAEMRSTGITVAKRKPGRPKGSKDKAPRKRKNKNSQPNE